MYEPAPRFSSITRAVIGLLLLSLPATAVVFAAATDLTGTQAPDFVLKSQSGENYRLSEFRGSVVVVNFWASWCGGCRRQLAELEELHSRHASDDLELFAVNLDRDRSEMSSAASELGLRFPSLHDVGGLVSKLYEVGSLPLSILIDRDGIVRHVVEDYEDTEQGAVEALLNEHGLRSSSDSDHYSIETSRGSL